MEKIGILGCGIIGSAIASGLCRCFEKSKPKHKSLNRQSAILHMYFLCANFLVTHYIIWPSNRPPPNRMSCTSSC